MSLINEMLGDLEKRRKQKTHQMPVVDTVMPDKTGMTGGKILGVIVAAVLLAGVVWAGYSLLPTLSAEKTPVLQPVPEQAVSIPPAASRQGSITISPLTVEGEKYGAPVHAVLPEMTLRKDDGAARLSLNFTRQPQYSLVQSGRGNVPLIVMFEKTTMGEHLKVPEVTGSVLERIRFQPGQEDLQLLVDLAAETQLESFELVEKSEGAYSLVMDFVQQIRTPVLIEEKQPYPMATPMATEELSDVAEEPPEAPGEHDKQQIVLTRKERLPSQDKQSYQTGLEQLHRGELAAAARSFSSVLAINPTHTRARLQLIATLQRLKQPEQAARQMRQGLELLPENRVLRKEYARYLLDNRRIDQAIELLRQSPVPAVADDVEYHALLAALLQESGQYSDAAAVYAGLLRVRKANAIWWLGLAISMDQIGNFEQAREGYRQALTLPGLDKNTREYIKNRLEVL
jgi:Flp pilus assembly protein TadD